jgi:hypothetical protein
VHVTCSTGMDMWLCVDTVDMFLDPGRALMTHS